MIVSSIVAVGNNNAIGIDNDLPWHLPADLKFFKETTRGHHVIMGRKSFESIGRPLPGRTNIIITKNTDFAHSGVIVKSSIPDALAYAAESGQEEVFILGGASVYAQTLNLWHRLYLTHVDAIIDNATAFFPDIDLDNWKLTWEDYHPADEKNKYACRFCLYER
jgi:dihydrofolate reductase